MGQAAAAIEALRLATIEPSQAGELATAAAEQARDAGDWVTVSLAERALGVAAFQLRSMDSSVAHLRASVSAAERAGSRRLVGEARMSLAATLGLSGSPARAAKEIASALGDLDGVAAARARVQRAAILQALGHHEEALSDLRHSLPVLRRAGDAEWEARGRSNRSLLHLARRSFAAAEADLVTARRLCTENGLHLAAAYAEQNLGCLQASRGDVVAALSSFDAAESSYRQLGLEVGSLLVDRSELLLSVRLVDEARSTAESAVRVLRAQKRHLQSPEAGLLLSTVALVQGDTETATAAALQAARGFSRAHRTSGVALARYARLQALMTSQPRSVTPAMARRCSDELEAAGWSVPALEARVAAGRIALARGRVAEARRDLELASRARRSGPAAVRARAWLAEALVRRQEGRRRSAVVALSTGLRVLEDYQATLGATELRAHVSTHRGALARLGLQMAVEDRDARRALIWAERGRATALLLRSPEPPDDPVLAGDLSDLRTTMTEIEERRAVGQSTSHLVNRQVRLEKAIADRCRRLPARPGTARARPRTVNELAVGLEHIALLEYIAVGDDLHVVTLVDGRARLRALGPMKPVRDQLAYLSFALRRLADPRARPAIVAAATTGMARTGELLDDLLVRPLAKTIGDRPLVIVPTGALQGLPWSVLPSCGGRPISLCPSATLWHDALGRPHPGPDARVVVIGGPTLPGAREESTAVASLYPGSLALLDDRATVSAACAAMDGAALVHIAAHGRLRSDNPFFSMLQLVDGPLTVYDLERLRRAPHDVVLAACDTARGHVVTGDEVLGLAAVLLSQGTSSLVAPVIAIPDVATVPFMYAFHQRLLAGLAPAAALASTQQAAAGDDILARATAAGFVCTGVGMGARSAVGVRTDGVRVHPRRMAMQV